MLILGLLFSWKISPFPVVKLPPYIDGSKSFSPVQTFLLTCRLTYSPAAYWASGSPMIPQIPQVKIYVISLPNWSTSNGYQLVVVPSISPTSKLES